MAKTKSQTTRPPCKQRKPNSAKLTYEGAFFDVWQWQHRFKDGATATFETITRPDTALVLPILKPGVALLAHERQVGMNRVFRTIGGKIKPHEAPEVAAQRELLEETGLKAGRLRLWAAWQPVNKLDWAVYLFVAHDVQKVADPMFESGEQVTTKEIAVRDLLRRPTELGIDDYELLFCLFRAKSDSREMRRVKSLLIPQKKAG